MAKNDPDRPELARAAQDVDEPAHGVRTSTEGNFHVGRGGAANVVRQSSEERRSSSKERTGSIVDKGKEMLGLKK